MNAREKGKVKLSNAIVEGKLRQENRVMRE